MNAHSKAKSSRRVSLEAGDALLSQSHTDCGFLHTTSVDRGFYFQVKAKLKEVQLHKDSPLGDTIMECYNSGSRNVFALGFVPVTTEHTVVLLQRDTPPNAPGIKDLGVDLSTWEALISMVLNTDCCIMCMLFTA